MGEKTIEATDFEASCLHIVARVAADRQPVTITKHGEPVAVLMPVAREQTHSRIIGALRGTVLRYDAPFNPAMESAEHERARR